jgi:two-component system, cell cycle sensor histidine kinase and response regulator CckA
MSGWLLLHTVPGRTRPDAAQSDDDELRSLIRNSPDVIERFDRDLRLVYANHALEQRGDASAVASLGRRPGERRLPPEAAAAWEGALRTVFAAAEPVTFEFTIPGPEGPRHYECRLIAERGADGAVATALAVSRDVTERRSLEAQLRQAQKMEAVGRLAGGVAHDFNNLLGVITGYTELLLSKRNAAPDAARVQLVEIRKAAERATALTRQLLAFSRKQIVDLRPLDLNMVLKDTESMLRRLIGEDIELRAILAPDVGYVKADAGQIEQVVMNLAVNARDAMPQGGQLTIETCAVQLDAHHPRTRVDVPPGRYVLLTVSDSGVGMDARTRAHLFEPFFTTKEEGKGTGLGLATVYGIVKQSGGHITVYSEPGVGSSFGIYLPRHDAPPDASPASGEEVDAAGGTETILLVEDDDGVRGLLQECLCELGYSVMAAESPRSALELAARAERPADLLLTDVVMPGMSGRQLAARLRDAGALPARVIYVSGYADEAIVHHGVLEANLDFLHKPFTPSALARKLREVLSRPAAPDA